MLGAVIDALKSAGVEVAGEKRGLDHGVWGESLGSPYLSAVGVSPAVFIAMSAPKLTW